MLVWHFSIMEIDKIMNPQPDPVIVPTFPLTLESPLPTSAEFIGATSSFFLTPVIGFFTACVASIILWKIIQQFTK